MSESIESRRSFLKSIGFPAAVFLFGDIARASRGGMSRPNILWLSCEDISPHIGCFGDRFAITPNIDKLAGDAVRYTNAFTTAGVCAPCRSGIITGMYQTTIGSHHMRCSAKLPGFIKAFTSYLRDAGYYCTNNSKTDYQTKDLKDVWDESSGKAHWKNGREGKPFFAATRAVSRVSPSIRVLRKTSSRHRGRTLRNLSCRPIIRIHRSCARIGSVITS